MTKTVTTYEPALNGTAYMDMVEVRGGSWVRWSDYERLEHERKRLQAIVDRVPLTHRRDLIEQWPAVEPPEKPFDKVMRDGLADLREKGGFLAEVERHRNEPAVPPAIENDMSRVAQTIAVLAAGCVDKEPEQLSEQERIALAIVSGCNFERTETGIRVTDMFGIQKINGKFIVGRRETSRPGDRVTLNRKSAHE